MSIFSSRPLLTLLAVVGLVLAADRLAFSATASLLSRSQERFSKLYFAPTDARIGIFGNSRAVHALHAPTIHDQFSQPTFSFAANGLNAQAVAVLMMDAVDRTPSLEVIFVEVSVLVGSGQRTAALRQYANRSKRLTQLFESQQQSVLPWPSIFQMASLDEQQLIRSLSYLNVGDQGVINTHAGITPMQLAAFSKNWRGTFELREDEVQSLQDAVDYALKRGIDVHLVLVPYHPAVRARPGFSDWVRTLENSLGRDVIDLSAATDGDEFFADPLHGNLSGAQIVARRLALYLERLNRPSG